MKKKALSIVLAGTMAVSMASVGAVSVSAEELAVGDYGSLGEYTPGTGIKTNKLMFAMPAAWQNDTTKNEKCGGAAGIYWWSGYDTPDKIAGGHGWPGYKAVQVKETVNITDEASGETKTVEVPNLWAIDVPTYGNGEEGNATQIIWNNYLDGGMEPDPAKNPFYAAATQTVDTPGQYLSRTDKDATYDILFRYIYVELFKKEGVEGVDALDLKSDDFWVEINKLAAKHLNVDYEKLSSDEKTFQVDNILDEMEYDMTEMFGEYGKNFFNEDLVGDEIYPKEESGGYGMSFHFDNMVYVVDFDVSKMSQSPVSKKLGFGGNFYFYYGAGEYGTWPTKELNTKMEGVSGSFITGDYMTKTMDDLMKEYEEYHKDDPTEPASTTVPAPATDATSSTSSTSSDSTSSNNSNGTVATGQVSMVVILMVVIAAGIGVAIFTRKKTEK